MEWTKWEVRVTQNGSDDVRVVRLILYTAKKLLVLLIRKVTTHPYRYTVQVNIIQSYVSCLQQCTSQ